MAVARTEDVLRRTLNVTAQCTFSEWSRSHQTSFLRIFTIIAVLTVLVVVVVLGNLLVIAAVLLRRRLRSATGILILSLAVADLLVGLVIIPFSIANEVLNDFWIFGDTWCTMWVTMDIWMCTASIYNLVAISIDRYIAIIKPLNYPMLVTKFRARCIVALVWVGSFLICSPSFMLASTAKPEDADLCGCTPANAGTAYVIFSASSSFYVPMIVVIFVYVRIYIAARAATKSIYSGMMQVTANANRNTKGYLMSHPTTLGKSGCADPQVPMLRVHRGSSVAAHRSPLPPSRSSAGNALQAPSLHNGHQNGSNHSFRVPTTRSTTNSNETSFDEKDEKANPDEHETSPPSTLPPKPPRSIHTYEQKPMKPIEEKSKDEEEKKDERRNSRKASDESDVPDATINGSNNTKKRASRWKKPRIGTNPFARLMRRTSKKRDGCAYEKRLSLEIKAAKTVAIVTGCFIFCWLGFSIRYGFEIETSKEVWTLFFWLGYLNSALNPVIYTVFNREFRMCFKRLLTCRHFGHNSTAKTYNTTNNINVNNSFVSTARPSKVGGCTPASTSSPPQVQIQTLCSSVNNPVKT